MLLPFLKLLCYADYTIFTGIHRILQSYTLLLLERTLTKTTNISESGEDHFDGNFSTVPKMLAEFFRRFLAQD